MSNEQPKFQTIAPIASVVFGNFNRKSDHKNYTIQERVTMVSKRRREAAFRLVKASGKGKWQTSEISKTLRSQFGSGLERTKIRHVYKDYNGTFVDDDPSVAERLGPNIDFTKPPPVGHPLRCHAKSLASGQRCGKWSISGSQFCQKHSGRKIKVGEHLERRVMALGTGYSAYLGPTLREKLAAHTSGKTFQEQIALYDEIALARLLVTQQVEVYSSLLQASTDESLPLKNRPGVEHLQQAAEVLNKAIGHVADLCAKMSQIERNMSDNVSLKHIASFADQITEICAGVLGTDPAGQSMAQRLGDAVRSQLRLPVNGEPPIAEELLQIHVQFNDPAQNTNFVSEAPSGMLDAANSDVNKTV